MICVRDVRARLRPFPSCAVSSLRRTVVVLLALASLAAITSALASNLDKVILFNIEAQSLDKALLQFGAQAHLQISFASRSAMRPMQTAKLTGSYTCRQALAELLKGSQLGFIEHGNTVEIVQAIPAAESIQAHPVEQADPAPKNIATKLGTTGSQNSYSQASISAPAQNRQALREVVITGSRLLSASNEHAQEVQIYDQQQIDESGQDSLPAFLDTLPSVSVSGPQTQGVSSTVQLRGLPLGTTLVLLNGRRLQDSGTTYFETADQAFDLNNIPLAVVQRIEVDENGSSAVYGSDAIAGVVNIILKDNFNGLAANARYGWAKDQNVIRTDLAWGKQWGRGGFSVIGSYDSTGAVLNSARTLTASNDYSRYGGPNNNYPDCFPANVYSLDGSPLPGAPAGSGASYAEVTGSTASGKPPLSQFTYNALNQCSLLEGSTLSAATQRGSLFAQGHIEIGPDVALFTEIMYTHMRQVEGNGYQFLFGDSGFQQYTVSAANPYNPFGEAVGVSGSIPGAPLYSSFDTDFFRPLLGLKGMIDERWQWETSVWDSTSWTRVGLQNDTPNTTEIQNALNSSDPASALNPFVDGPLAMSAVLGSLFSPYNAKLMSRDQSIEAFMRGPVAPLPAGNIEGVVGADYVRSTFSFTAPATAQIYDRSYRSLFAEVKVPIARGWENPSAGNILDMTASGRHDQYSDFGGATTGQLGVDIRPLRSLVFRGTYASAFEAPALTDLYNPDVVSQTVVIDPSTGAPALVQLVQGGDTHLRPMIGRSHSFGIVYSGGLPGLRVAITQWQVIERNVIQNISPEVLAESSASFPDRVIRDSSGALSELVDTSVNFGSIDAAGVDYDLAYSRNIAGARVAASLSATETYHYTEALIPGAQPIEAVSEAQDDGDWAPRWKGTVGLGLTQGVVDAHVDGRYTSTYQDYDSTRRIGNFWLVDADIRWSVGKLFGSSDRWLRDEYFEIGATNLLNRAAQFSNYNFDLVGYDPAEMSVIGRSLYVRCGIHW